MIVFLLNVAGAAALLIYAVRMVRTGVERAFSVPLRRWLRVSSRSRLVAAASGTLTALVLQSSTAVVVLAAGFIGAGTLSAAVGLAMVLGADVGSALAVQVLVLRPPWLASLLLLAGVATFLRAQEKPGRQIGRICVGLALIFLALDLIAGATGAIREAPGLAAVAARLQGDLLTAFGLGAGLAWVINSSVATVLLVAAFATSSILPLPVAAAMVAGANLGGGFIAVTLTLNATAEARRMVWANTVLRSGGALLLLALLAEGVVRLDFPNVPVGQQVILLHLFFNLAIAVPGLLLVPLLLAALSRLIREPAAPAALEAATALDPRALAQPERALACAAREVLHMGETAEAMLRPVLRLFSGWNPGVAATIAGGEARLDRMNRETKTYLAQLPSDETFPDQSRRVDVLVDQAAHFEAAGDAIARIAFGLARKVSTEGSRFSEEGAQEIADFHDFVLSTAQMALEVQMTRDPGSARALVAEKERARDLERRLQHAHHARLRDGNADSVATSNIHQEMLRELKLINTCFAMVAYPILSEKGDLLDTRLGPVEG